MRRVLVVGGGPAGLAAAIHAAGAGAAVTLVERNRQCGAKLLATGGGRCNIANLRPLSEWPALFGRRGRFIVPALDFLNLVGLRSWLAALGVPLVSPDGFHLFPVDQSARTVRDALTQEAGRMHVRIVPEARPRRLLVSGGAVSGVAGEAGEWSADRVIVASGGLSYPATGSTGDGHELARLAGHRIERTFPGLVGLRVANLSPDLAGLVLPDAAVSFKLRGERQRIGRGELLLTHGGISGPAVLDLSGAVNEAFDGLKEKGERLTLRLRWLHDWDVASWKTELALWRQKHGATPLCTLLRRHVPQRLARWLCAASGVPEGGTAANLSSAARDRLSENLGSYPAEVAGDEGWEKAMITRGGVELRGVSPATLESGLLSGLHFAGEVLDVDGPCGGYNLHWALASGALAGDAAGRVP